MDESVWVLDRSAGCINGKETGDQKGRERGPYGGVRVWFAEGSLTQSKQGVWRWSC